MGLIIETKAKKHIAQSGKAATIRYSNQGCCHTGTVGVPIVYLGIPKDNLMDYQKIEKDEIEIYLSKEIDLEKENLKLSLSQLLVWKKLTLEGGKTKK